MLTKRIALYRLIALGALGVTLVAQAQDVKPVAEAPTLKVAESWKYELRNIGDKREPVWFTNTVTAVDDKQAVVAGEHSTEGKFWWLYDTKASKFLARFRFDEAAADKRGAKTEDRSESDSLMQFPMQVGKKYPVKQKWVNSSGDNGDSDLKAEVVAFEKVKTLAGEFDAYKIEVDGWWNNRRWSSSGRQSVVLWYAPSVKREVKMEYKDFTRGGIWNHRTFELMEFKAGQ